MNLLYALLGQKEACPQVRVYAQHLEIHTYERYLDFFPI